jgi:hypothetical protein
LDGDVVGHWLLRLRVLARQVALEAGREAMRPSAVLSYLDYLGAIGGSARRG